MESPSSIILATIYVFCSECVFTLIEAHVHLTEHTVQMNLLHVDLLLLRIQQDCSQGNEFVTQLHTVVTDTYITRSHDHIKSSHDQKEKLCAP